MPTDRAPASVMVVEDDPLLCSSLARVVATSPGLVLLASTGSAVAAAQRLRDGPPPDVLLVDLGLPDGDGVDLIRLHGRVAPRAAALVLSVFADEENVVRALAAGAQGYLVKDAGDAEVRQAIRDVLDGHAPLSARVARHVLRRMGVGHRPPADEAPSDQRRLTVREVEVLTLLSHGHTAAEIAQQLALSLHTVNSHLRNSYTKLEARNRVEALARARAAGEIR